MSLPDGEGRAEVWKLFDALADCDREQQRLRLAALDAHDAALATELRALLAADERASGVLDEPLPAELNSEPAPEPLTRAGSTLGRYRLLAPLGQGGMGEVWRGERTDGVFSQQVAIKLLKRGLDTEAVLLRFRQEREILARLDHPAIVRVLDGGMDPDGRPWFAMDLVDGEGVVAYAKRLRLDVRERVALMIQIIDAVAYAHGRLVVHRDLKPGNILVDQDGRPRLLDFGIAKLLEGKADETLTGFGTRLMSPAYAAPEQILGHPISTATDVYGLGMVLFELLTGQLPMHRNSRDPALLAHVVTREPPARASHVLACAGENAVHATYGKGADARRLTREISRDLDSALAMALRAEPSRRYATAAAFAADLRCWLDGRPIAAQPDSRSYRLRRFVARHRVGVATAATMALALLFGLFAALWLADAARQQAARAELVKRFVLSLFAENDPIARDSVLARTPQQLVAEGIDRAERELREDPVLRLDVLADLGQLLASLGNPVDAGVVLERVYRQRVELDGADSVAAAQVQAELAVALLSAGQGPTALAHARSAVGHLERAAGADALGTARARVHYGRILLIVGNAEEALSEVRRALAVLSRHLGPDHGETLEAQSSLAVAFEHLDRLDEATEAFFATIAGIERSFGAEHARMIRPLVLQADILRRQQRYEPARQLLERALGIATSALGEHHPRLAQVLMRYGDLLRRTGELDAASAALERAASILPADSGEAAQVAMFRGGVARAQNDHAAALAAFAEAHAIFLSATGADSIYPWVAQTQRGSTLADLGRLDEARQMLTEAVERLEAISGPDSFDGAQATGQLGRVWRELGQAEVAWPLLEHTVTRVRTLYGPEHPSTLDAQLELAKALKDAGRLHTAREHLDAALRHTRQEEAPRRHLDLLIESVHLARREGNHARAASDAAAALEWANSVPALADRRTAAERLVGAEGL